AMTAFLPRHRPQAHRTVLRRWNGQRVLDHARTHRAMHLRLDSVESRRHAGPPLHPNCLRGDPGVSVRICTVPRGLAPVNIRLLPPAYCPIEDSVSASAAPFWQCAESGTAA